MNLRADRRVGLLLAGVVVLVFVAIGATVALPATDETLAKDATKLSAAAQRGMKVFRSEGCWYCHTQYVRHTSTDAALGEPLVPGAYADRSPSMLGMERIGPDLLTIDAADEGALVAALRDHGAAGSLSYLSKRQLEALAAYLLSHK